jgi:hypothetical protein
MCETHAEERRIEAEPGLLFVTRGQAQFVPSRACRRIAFISVPNSTTVLFNRLSVIPVYSTTSGLTEFNGTIKSADKLSDRA